MWRDIFWTLLRNSHFYSDLYLYGQTLSIYVHVYSVYSDIFLSASLQSVNPYLKGQRLDNVVAKKSVPHFSEEEEEEAPTASAASKSTT